MQTSLGAGEWAGVILPTQQMNKAFQRINHWIKYHKGSGDLYMGSINGVKILTGVGSKEKSQVCR